jgi:hypothetical protein
MLLVGIATRLAAIIALRLTAGAAPRAAPVVVASQILLR